jgi:hypothetical protein
MKCIGLLHLEHVGGGGFFGMVLTLHQAQAKPLTVTKNAEHGTVIAASYCDDYGFVCPVPDLGW